MCHPGKCGALSLGSEFAFDQPVQVLTDGRIIKAFDHFIEKSGDKKALGHLCGNPACAEIEELVFIDLARRCTMGATDVVGEDFQARH